METVNYGRNEFYDTGPWSGEPERCFPWVGSCALLENIRLSWKGLPAISTLAYYEQL
jgi:hypothetical protein